MQYKRNTKQFITEEEKVEVSQVTEETSRDMSAQRRIKKMLEVPHAKPKSRQQSNVLASNENVYNKTISDQLHFSHPHNPPNDDLLGNGKGDVSRSTVIHPTTASCQQLRPSQPSVLTDQTMMLNQFQRQDNSFPAYYINKEHTPRSFSNEDITKYHNSNNTNR